MTILEKIFQLISDSGLSDYKLEQLIGLKQSSVNNWRRGKGNPSADALLKIADYFKVSVDYLLGREEKKPTGDEPVSWLEQELENRDIKDKLEKLPPEYKDSVMNILQEAVNSFDNIKKK